MNNFFYKFYKPFLKKEGFKMDDSLKVQGILIRSSQDYPPTLLNGNLNSLLEEIFFSKFSNVPYSKTRINEDFYFYHYDLRSESIQIYKPNFIANCVARLHHPDKHLSQRYYGPVFAVSSAIFESSITKTGKNISSQIGHFPSAISHQIYKVYEHTQSL